MTFSSGEVLTAANLNAALGPSRILQIAHSETETQYLTTATTYQDITALTTSITPQSTSSTLLVLVTLTVGHDDYTGGFIRMKRNGATIALDPAAWFYSGNSNSGYAGLGVSFMAAMSPASTSAQTLLVQFKSENANWTTINRSRNDSSQSGASTMTIFEVSA